MEFRYNTFRFTHTEYRILLWNVYTSVLMVYENTSGISYIGRKQVYIKTNVIQHLNKYGFETFRYN